jgi:predicted MFS family arabinose efflux permease
VPGHVLFVVSALSALFWLTSVGHRFAWISGTSIALFATAVVALAWLYWHERTHPAPFLPMDLLREKTIALSAVLVLLFAGCLFAIVFFLPVYLQLGHRMSAQLSGLLLLPLTAGQVTSAITASRLLRRSGNPHLFPVVGMSVSSAALLLLGLLPPHMLLVIVLGFVTGLGLGTVMPINQVVVQTVAGRARLGAATAMTSLARSTGAAAGAALFGALAFAMIPGAERQSLLGAATEHEIAAVMQAFHRAFLVTAVVAGLAAFTASRIPRVKLWEPRAGAQT